MFQHVLWHSPGRVLTVIGASMLIVAAVFWIYWTQVRSLRAPWRWMMPSLRGLALVVLMISIIQPVIVRPRTSAERGAIVLLMDRSASMSVVDADRTPSQLVSLADGLKDLPPGVRPRDAARLGQAPDMLSTLTDQLFLARGQLDYAHVAGQNADVPAAKMAQLARQASAFADLLAEYPRAARLAQELAALASQTDLPADQWSRDLASLSDTLSTAIAQAQTSADNDLYRSNDTVRSACDQIQSLSREALVNRALTSPKTNLLGALMSQAPVFGFSFADSIDAVPLERADGSAVKSIPIHANGAQSDITAALAGLRQKMQGKLVQAVVLFSDGRQVGSDLDLSPILTTASAPIFTVNCAGPVRKDLAMLRMTWPTSLFVDESGTVHVEIRSVGYRDSPINLILEVDGQKLVQQMTVDDAKIATVDFPLKLLHPGVHSLVVSIPPQPGEATNLNNQIRRSIKVLGDQINVLAISSWPGWDFEYLNQALAKAPFVKLQTAVATGEGAILPLTPQQILEQNVVLFSDVRADALSTEQWQAVHDLVVRDGGSILIVPGDPKNLLDISQRAHMADLLPMQNVNDAVWRVWPGEQPYFQLAVPPDQIADTPLRFADDPTASAQVWLQLPGMFRFMPVTGANPQVRTMLIERDSGLPVLTEMPAGAGRAFFFGARETWRWRQKIGGQNQDRFWLQLLRNAAPPTYTARDLGIAFDVDPIDASPGEPIHVRAQTSGNNVVPIVHLMRGGRVAMSVTMQQSPNHATGQFEATLRDLLAGDYELNVSLGEKPGASRLALHVGAALEPELSDVSGDDDRLRRIAAGTGGEDIAFENVADLPHKILEAGRKQPGFFEYPLWDSPWLFGLIVGCLGTEWALRKRFGLA